jgi:hypothetical protein
MDAGTRMWDVDRERISRAKAALWTRSAVIHIVNEPS